MKYDCNKTLDYQHELQRMCAFYGNVDCIGNCPFADDPSCAAIESNRNCNITSQTINIIQQWSDTHPVTTRLEQFQECIRDTDFENMFDFENGYPDEKHTSTTSAAEWWGEKFDCGKVKL